ncbi:MAG: 23S rRNA (uracil(1939)-C(5))-methyltransferase RlmD [Prevotella sp.]|nr:23S rRNA (uracil(1939)-C(5))-methyltransferase RlmD [Prevotella sp.]
MARNKKPLPILKNITITDFAADGKSLVRHTVPAHDGQPESRVVIFVPFCVPGDVVDLRVIRKKHNYWDAEVARFIQYSEVRQEPMCQHFGTCGGCKWQQLPYPEQLKMKQAQVIDQLTRIGKVELPECMPILGSKKTQEYRNKLDFGCANRRYLTREEIQSLPKEEGESLKDIPAMGFHITGAFDKILPIEKCWLMDDLHNQIRNSARDYALEHGLSFFDLRQQTGLLRDVIIRCSNTGEWMVIVQFKFPENQSNLNNQNNPTLPEDAKGFLQFLGDKFPQISALLWVDNQKCNDTFGDLPIHVFKGNDHIFLEMEGLKFKVGPKSFYQTNTDQAYELYKVARRFAFEEISEDSDYSEYSEDSEKPLVYDLYTGTGTIANFVAKKARQVIGIEYVPEAIEDAKVNSEINHIGNTLFYAGDMKDILNDEFIGEHGRPDVIITDPPRAGMHPDVVDVILKAEPRRIVYVSCNPATQARDLQLMDVKYRVAAIQPVDMFPHTPHVENVVLLIKK